MPSTSNELMIVDAVIQRLKTVTDNVFLGYSATGIEGQEATPFIMVMLESLNELGRQGNKARYTLQFNISTAVKTSDNATYELLTYVRSIREALESQHRICNEVRKHTLDETLFDIAPGPGQLSFADMALMVEAVL